MEKTQILAPLIAFESVSHAKASTGTIQPDLLYVDSVLVSTGQNKNDDVFLPGEMWSARATPILKPVDWEHNTGKEMDSEDGKRVVADNQIIGVMYNSFAAHKDGTKITEAQAQAADFNVPQDFDIINQAVIYKYLFPKAAARIVKDAKAGKLFVSMEAWFSGYDYKVGNKIVARNQETAFLDRHLRANGGDGTFAGQRVGRVLRNITFGGVGIVSNPANADSVIQSFTNASAEDVEMTNSAIASNIIGDVFTSNLEVKEIMANENNVAATSIVPEEGYKEVVTKLVKAELLAETKTAEAAEAKSQVEKLEAAVNTLTEAFIKGGEQLSDILGAEAAGKLAKTAATDFFKVLADVVGAKLGAIKGIEQELASAKQKIVALEVEKRNVVRSAEISKLLAEFVADQAFAKSRLEKMVKASEPMDDAAFAAYLAETRELLSMASKKEPVVASAPVADEGVTDVAVLENVTASAAAPAGTDNATPPVDLVERMKSLANDLLTANKR